jgi:DNA (cytosine-5)-methyltransferase 1
MSRMSFAAKSASVSKPRTESDRRLLCRKSWPDPPSGRRSLRVVDLFSGAGGMSLGAYLASRELGLRFEVALAIEKDAQIARIYEANFSAFGSRLRAPIMMAGLGVDELFDGPFGTSRRSRGEQDTAERTGPVDVLMGGPPCQGNSDLNNHTRRVDPRNDLYERMARAAEVLGPRTVLIENVPAVVHGRGRVVDRAEQALNDLGYTTGRAVLAFDRLGVPQRRRRHVLLGARGMDPASMVGLVAELETAASPNNRDVRWAIQDLEGVDSRPGRGGFDDPPEPSADNARRLEWFQKNEGAFELPDRHRPGCHRDKDHSYKSIYGRLRWDEPAQTVTTGFGSMGQGRYVHPEGLRTITPHEAARLQTFPDFFRFDVTSKRTVWAKAIGNAVPPFGMRRVLVSLLRSMP